jgi:hypothetical protein
MVTEEDGAAKIEDSENEGPKARAIESLTKDNQIDHILADFA